MKTQLTPQQRKNLNNIIEYMELHDGDSPAIADLQSMGQYASDSTVSYMLDVLESKGHITRKKGVGRSIELL